MKLSQKAFNFAQKILKLQEKEEKLVKPTLKDDNSHIVDEKRIVGRTDYKKYEELAKNLELEELTNDQNTKDALKMGCNNDLRKERQMVEKPFKDKVEAAKIFKNEGDDFLKTKNYADAINSYEKGILQLFYTFSDDPEDDKLVDTVKASINMNMAMCKMNLNKYEEAIGYCQEALRINKANMKSLYRIAFCYFKLEKFEESRKFIQDALLLDPDNQEFKALEKMIVEKEKELEDNTRRLFKKIMK